MGWVMMSERELNRSEVLAQVDDGRLSVDNAANMLDLTRRQIFRLLKRYRQQGASTMISQGWLRSFRRDIDAGVLMFHLLANSVVSNNLAMRRQLN